MTWTNDQRPVFAKSNVILLGIGLLLIITGFLLMLGSANTAESFNESIFSFRRVTIAPMTALFGFLFIIFAILRTSKKEKK
ncbi:MAG: DUF3098 domain-containing protein [Prevotellaceae bacterium]|jgi:uncharacterized BrkB/YihY/UPF0761 family membrane protein|nr:DUF3098 domain-containing protein [Prevotellaceae bacterium]